MEREIPRNVRQIGNISGGPKIYVEDYVDTFFAGLCEKCEKADRGNSGSIFNRRDGRQGASGLHIHHRSDPDV